MKSNSMSLQQLLAISTKVTAIIFTIMFQLSFMLVFLILFKSLFIFKLFLTDVADFGASNMIGHLKGDLSDLTFCL